MRNKHRVGAVEVASPPPPVVIVANAVYTAPVVRQMLGLRASSLRREIREGRLRVSKRCGRYYFIGEQLLDWLRDGELSRDNRHARDDSSAG